MSVTTVRSTVVPGRSDPAPAPARRPMSVSGYVHAPFAEVLRLLSGSEARKVLEAAMVNGLDFADGEITVELGAPALYVNGSARLELAWRGDDNRGRVRHGEVTVSVLQVQSGDDAITELLVRTEIDRSSAPRAAWAIHRCLDELSAMLE